MDGAPFPHDSGEPETGGYYFLKVLAKNFIQQPLQVSAKHRACGPYHQQASVWGFLNRWPI